MISEIFLFCKFFSFSNAQPYYALSAVCFMKTYRQNLNINSKSIFVKSYIIIISTGQNLYACNCCFIIYKIVIDINRINYNMYRR